MISLGISLKQNNLPIDPNMKRVLDKSTASLFQEMGVEQAKNAIQTMQKFGNSFLVSLAENGVDPKLWSVMTIAQFLIIEQFPDGGLNKSDLELISSKLISMAENQLDAICNPQK